MNLAILKKFRIVISLIFLFATVILFLELSGTFTESTSSIILFLQFYPSFTDFISLPSLGAIGFILVLIITLFFGRVYCSTICPLGTLQDIFIFLKRRKTKKIKYDFEFYQPLNLLRYSILLASIFVFLTGSIYLLFLLDPFSNFGRIMVNLVKPLVIGGNNILSYSLESFNVYSVSPHTFKGIDYFSFIFALMFVALVIWLALTKGRLFCNSVCPVGTFLGFVSKFSIFKIVVNEETCTGCGVCEKVCKSNCIESETKYVDFSRCVSCFNCFDICPTHGLKYDLSINKNGKQNLEINDPVRRDFITGIFTYTIGLTAISVAQQKIEVYKENDIKVFRHNAISPPGSISTENMNYSCTACQLCVSVCPSQVLQPSFLEYGFLGMMQPRMDNKTGFCDYECVLCSEVCPSGAIRPITTEQKKLIQIGKANFIEDNCVVKTQEQLVVLVPSIVRLKL